MRVKGNVSTRCKGKVMGHKDCRLFSEGEVVVVKNKRRPSASRSVS
jgi:hypothetical protein